MRILLATVTYAPIVNGQAVFTCNLANRLAQQGHSVAVIYPSQDLEEAETLENDVLRVGVKSLNLEFWHPDAYTTLWMDPAVERLFERFRPQLVHIHDHYPLCWNVEQVARRRGIPLVGTNHFVPDNVTHYLPYSNQLQPFFDWVLWRWLLQIYNGLDCVTVQSQTAAQALRQAGLTAPLMPVSCGIDTEHFHVDAAVDRVACRRRFGLDAERVTFLFVGRMDAEKRLDVLIRALAALDRPDIALAIAGKGTAGEQWRKLAQELGVADRVHFLGYVPEDDLPTLLNSVDVFAMPSDAELLSIATLEAMACGRPVLAARARALPELVEDGVNWRLFRPGDVRDAAAALRSLVDAPSRWPQMGAASLQRAAQHDWANVVEKYESIYRSLQKTRGDRRRTTEKVLSSTGVPLSP
ncbi:MAG: glycosyltransferase [Caldilineaceae bacterium]